MVTEFAGLATPRFRLRLPEDRDTNALVALAGDFRIYDTTENIPHPYQRSDAAAFIERAQRQWQSKEALHVVVAGLDDDAVRAYALLRFDAGLNSAELGYWVGAPYWRQGIATEAGQALIDYAFLQLKLHRLCACYLGRNPESGRVLQKLGFVDEGVQREHSFKHGQAEDLVLMGLLRREWQPD